MGLKQVKYIQLDDQKGELYASDRQSLLVPVYIFKTIRDIFDRLVGREGCNILMAKIGQGLGQGYALSLKSILDKEDTEVSRESKVRIAINAIFMESGWGTAEIRRLDLGKGIFDIEVSNTPSASVLKDDRFDLEGGIMAGIIKEVNDSEAHYKIKKKSKNKILISVTPDEGDGFKEKEKMALLSRKELEEKIEEATKRVSEEKKKLSSIITSFADGLIMVDKHGVVNIVNPQAEYYMDVDGDDLIGKHIKDTELCSCFYDLYSQVKKASKKEETVTRETSTECNPQDDEGVDDNEENSRSKYYKIIGKAVIDSEDKMIGCTLVIHDVTREKVIDQLKSEFISIAAHQLRTPLSGIRWALQMILDGEMGKINEEVREYLGRTLEKNNKLIDLVNDLLNVSRIEEGRFVYRPTKVSLEDIVKCVVSNKKESAKKRDVRIRVNKPSSSLPKIRADEEKIQIALTNVLDNAIKYSYKGGTVNVKLSKVKKKRKDHVRAEILDRGIGIKEKDAKKLFTKFYRGSNALVTETQGSGLGLFIVKNIVEAHEGEIDCCPRKKCNGTKVIIDFPVENKLKK